MTVHGDIVREYGKTLLFDVGDRIFEQGEASDEMYVIVRGAVHIFFQPAQQNPVLIAKLAQGDFFGEMSLLEGLPRSGTAIAAEPLELIQLDESSFRQLMHGESEFPWRVMKGLSSRLREQNEMIAERVGRGLKEVASRLTENLAAFTAAVHDIAKAAQDIEQNGHALAEYVTDVEQMSHDMIHNLDSIRDFAAKTKIIGFNASIEASRAGEHGRGFQVITKEIRNLSQQFREHADAIATLTEQIGVKMAALTQASADSVQQTQSQSQLTTTVSNAIEELSSLSNRLLEISESF